METMSELYDIKKLTEGTYPLSFKLIDHYQSDESLLMEKLKCTEYHKGYFRGGWITTELVTYKYKIFIPQKIQ